MSRKPMTYATVECTCGRIHFVCFRSEMIVCSCEALTEVSGNQYTDLPPDEAAMFIDDVKGYVEGYSDNTSRPPKFDSGQSPL